MKTYLVTGGTGFIGRAIVLRLAQAGNTVRVLDNNLRGTPEELLHAKNVELVEADIRDAAAVQKACVGVDAVVHLAYLNGTEFFYSKPELVLDIGVKGMINIIDGCIKEKVPELFTASSSEVYHHAAKIPTDESVALTIPDPLNPRYSYAAGKIISEMMTINYGRKHFKRAVVFRPHNVYGPDMGWEHVIPQFVVRMKEIASKSSGETVSFPIQGTGKQTRAFIYINDFTDGLMKVIEKGEHLNIYHIGTMDEVSIAEISAEVGKYFGKKVSLVAGEEAKGAPDRRCPDIGKLSALGFAPKITLQEGVKRTAEWYEHNLYKKPKKSSADGRVYDR